MAPQQLLIHYLIMQVCIAFEKNGLFDVLRKTKKPVSISDLSKTLRVQEDLLRVCIDFLWSVTDILEKTERGIMLKNPGSFPDGFIVAAYKSVFDNIGDLLSGAKKYGREVNRDGYELQKASDMLSKETNKRVLLILGKIKNDFTLVDLGCGSAQLLIRHCSTHKNNFGVGVDADKAVVVAAQKNAADAGCKKNIQIVNADLKDIEKWSGYIPKDKPVVFFASTVLHELLYTGEQGLVSALREIKKKFPGARLLTAEFDALSFEDIKRENNLERKFFAAAYMFWHPLTHQGFPRPQSEWQNIFKKSGWAVNDIERTNKNVVIYDCLA